MRFIAEIQQSDGYNSVVWNLRTDSFEMLRQTILALVWEGPSTEDLVPLERVSLVYCFNRCGMQGVRSIRLLSGWFSRVCDICILSSVGTGFLRDIASWFAVDCWLWVRLSGCLFVGRSCLGCSSRKYLSMS
jgi:hypothetical protein